MKSKRKIKIKNDNRLASIMCLIIAEINNLNEILKNVDDDELFVKLAKSNENIERLVKIAVDDSIELEISDGEYEEILRVIGEMK